MVWDSGDDHSGYACHMDTMEATNLISRVTYTVSQCARVFYLLYELQKYIVIRQGRGNDAAGARGHKRQVMDVRRRSFG